MTNIIILDDHPIIRISLTNMLKQIYPNSNIYQTSNIKEFYNIIHTTKPIDLAFIDIFLQNNECGLSVIQSLKTDHHNAIAIVFSLYESPEIQWILKKYQVNAFFPKSIELSVIQDYLMKIDEYKKRFFTVNSQLNNELNDLQLTHIEHFINNINELTPLEYNILKLKANQYKNNDIAQILNIKLKTVENYINRISDKIVHKDLKFNDFINKYHEIIRILLASH